MNREDELELFLLDSSGVDEGSVLQELGPHRFLQVDALGTLAANVFAHPGWRGRREKSDKANQSDDSTDRSTP